GDDNDDDDYDINGGLNYTEQHVLLPLAHLQHLQWLRVNQQKWSLPIADCEAFVKKVIEIAPRRFRLLEWEAAGGGAGGSLEGGDGRSHFARWRDAAATRGMSV
ncbi:hypothetical protein HDU76_003321, partial [Blyttiomyces sp. JEL0837]